MFSRLDLFSLCTDPVQHLITANAWCTVDDLYDLYDLYGMYDLCDLCDMHDIHDLFDLYNLYGLVDLHDLYNLYDLYDLDHGLSEVRVVPFRMPAMMRIGKPTTFHKIDDDTDDQLTHHGCALPDGKHILKIIQ